jgi:hypothetical protein
MMSQRSKRRSRIDAPDMIGIGEASTILRVSRMMLCRRRESEKHSPHRDPATGFRAHRRESVPEQRRGIEQREAA